MFRLFIKGSLAVALAIGTINSFAQDFGVTCTGLQCKCDNSPISSCCGTFTCTLVGATCNCT